ncbi:hypothetical protein SmJEL517_g01833 [Synchytrium microbalum]|uniref:Mitochondrial carrier protein n=1 Tax=Synchytrium microbalum TaxID=1806994 RepID=A0A507CEN9_9FUNG|nr:uncharacterized protein SmJEL517_g01833 [Synchytrium microbalum]TPX35983.1 hypothetical protein SmJEL517_g01833 [Synchytrium microbalum]
MGDNPSAVKDLFAGAVGGIVLVGQPFDTVKVRLQTQSLQNPVYSSMMDCVSKTYKADGFRGFYKGTLTPLIGIGACVSIQFGALEYVKRSFTESNTKAGQANPASLSLSQLFLAGAVSGTANSILSGPIEHVRTRLQVQSGTTKEFSGPVDFAKKTMKQFGIAGIYKGQAITMGREFIGYGAYFLTYEYLIQRAMEKNNIRKRSDVPAYLQVIYGGFSGMAMWFSIYPIDVVKSKLQTDALDPAKRQYKSAIHCFSTTVKAEGMAGLYRGFWVCMLRAFPVNAATFLAFEATMNVIGR